MKQKFKAVAKKDPRNPQGEPKFYPSPVYNGTYSIDDVSKYIANISTVSEIDTVAVLSAFTKVIPELLQKGIRIDLEGIGIFSLGFETTASEKPEDVTSNNVEKVRLKFSAEHKLKQKLENTPLEKA